MLGHFDHRFATYRGATQAQLNKGTLPRVSDRAHDDPFDDEPLPRHWIDLRKATEVIEAKWDREWMLGWRDITNASSERSFVPFVFPKSAAGDTVLVAFLHNPEQAAALQAVWSSLAFDYVARQKLSGTHMKYFTTKQIACPTPSDLSALSPWDQSTRVDAWLLPYVVELSYTSWRLQPYAEDLGYRGAPFRWHPERRELLRADLDAGFLHLYGLNRSQAEHVIDSFYVVRKYEERDFGEYRTKRLVLEAYDRIAEAIAGGGKGWKPLADPPAGSGPRHHKHT